MAIILPTKILNLLTVRMQSLFVRCLQLQLVLALLLTTVRAQSSQLLGVEPVILSGPEDGPRSCSTSAVVQSTTSTLFQTIQNQLLRDCGGFGWRQVVDLDMRDASQQCPRLWVEFSNLDTQSERTCSTSIETAGCEGVTFPVPGGTYTSVCGRIIGYAVNTLDGFISAPETNINGPYLDGVSLTYGRPRQHIWSFGTTLTHPNRCPCENNFQNADQIPPAYVGDNYFCDGPYNGAVWDGEDCTVPCCTFNSPPYFNVTLPAPTSAGLEVRMCRNEMMRSEHSPIRLMQLYVQ